MSKKTLDERLEDLYNVLISGTNAFPGYDRLVAASAVDEAREIIRILFSEVMTDEDEIMWKSLPIARFKPIKNNE